MARPKTDTILYFQHDASASGGDTLTVLEERFGNDGYAFWFKLLEKLAATDGHYLDCSNPIKWQALCAKAHVTSERGEAILVLLLEMEAVDRELWKSRVIWCQKLVNRMEDVYKNRKRPLPQRPVSSSITPVSTIETPPLEPKQGVSGVETPQSKVKEIIVKDSKVVTPPTPSPGEVEVVKNVYQFWVDEGFGKLTVFESEQLRDACDYYTEDWVYDALKEAVNHHAKSWAYVSKVLENWKELGRNVTAGELKKITDHDRYDKGEFGHMVIKNAADVDAALKERGIKRGDKRTIEEIQAELAPPRR